MPVNVIRLDATARKIEEVSSVSDGALHWAADNPGDYPHLSQIDLYGETEFANSDLDLIAEEWQRLVDETTNDHELSYALSVRDILDRARREPGGSVRFLGD